MIKSEKDLFLLGVFSPLVILPLALSFVRDKSLQKVQFGMLVAIILIMWVAWVTKEVLIETAHGVFLISFNIGKTPLWDIVTDISYLDPYVYGILLTALLLASRLIF